MAMAASRHAHKVSMENSVDKHVIVQPIKHATPDKDVFANMTILCA